MVMKSEGSDGNVRILPIILWRYEKKSDTIGRSRQEEAEMEGC